MQYSCTRIKTRTLKTVTSPASTMSKFHKHFKGFADCTLVSKELVRKITADPCMFLDIYNFNILRGTHAGPILLAMHSDY